MSLTTTKLLGEPNPILRIDETGKIIQLVNVSFLGANASKGLGDTVVGPTVELDDIIYDTTGSVEFVATTLGDLDGDDNDKKSPNSDIWGNSGLFEMQRTWDFVLIENESAHDLTVNRIDGARMKNVGSRFHLNRN